MIRRLVRAVVLFANLAVGVLALGAQTTITVYSLKGPSGLGMIGLFESPPAIPGFTVKVEALGAADLMAAKFISGEAKIGILPPNIAAKIASAGKAIQVAAVVGTGMLSLLTADESIRTIADLRGKTLEVAGQGATPDYVIRRILKSNSLDPDRDVRLGYSLSYPEIAQGLIAGRVGQALLPEPFATMASMGNPRLRALSDVQDEWVRSGGTGDYPMTVLVVDSRFAAERKDVLLAVLAAYRDSIDWVKANPEAAGVLAEKHRLGLSAPVAAAAIPKSAYVFIPALKAKPALVDIFATFLSFAPASIGGRLPKDDFYLSWDF